MNPEGTLIKIISGSTLAANSLVRGRAYGPRLTQTHRRTTHTCICTCTWHAFPVMHNTSGCIHVQNCVQICTNTCTHMCTLIPDAHECIQVPDYSWDVHASTHTHMHLIALCMPRLQKAIYAHTHTCTHWLDANGYPCIKGERKNYLLMFQKYWCQWCSTVYIVSQ